MKSHNFLHALVKANRAMLNRRRQRYLSKRDAADAFLRGLVPYLRRGDAAQYRVAWREYVDALLADDAVLPSARDWSPPRRPLVRANAVPRRGAKMNPPKRGRADVPEQFGLFDPRPAPAAPVLSAADIERARWEAEAPARWADEITKLADKALPFQVFGLVHAEEHGDTKRWSILPLCTGPSGQSVVVSRLGQVTVHLSTGRTVTFRYGTLNGDGYLTGPHETYHHVLEALWSDGPNPPAAFGRFWHTEGKQDHQPTVLSVDLPGPDISTGYGDETMRSKFVVDGPVLIALQCVRLESHGSVSVDAITRALSDGLAELRYAGRGSRDAGWFGFVPITKDIVMHLAFQIGRTPFGGTVVPVHISFAPIPATMIGPADMVQTAQDAERWVPTTWKAVIASKWDRKHFGPVKQRAIGEAERILATHSKKRWAAPIKDMLRTLRSGDL